MKTASLTTALFVAFASTIGSAQAATALIPLAAVDNSGETGTAILTDTPAGLKIVVKLKNAPAAPVIQPEHIHPGTCANSNPQPTYPLANGTAGKTSTTVLKGVTLASLAGKAVINVHKSSNEMGIYVVCGAIAAK